MRRPCALPDTASGPGPGGGLPAVVAAALLAACLTLLPPCSLPLAAQEEGTTPPADEGGTAASENGEGSPPPVEEGGTAPSAGGAESAPPGDQGTAPPTGAQGSAEQGTGSPPTGAADAPPSSPPPTGSGAGQADGTPATPPAAAGEPFVVLEDVAAWVNEAYITRSELEQEKERQRDVLFESGASGPEMQRALAELDQRVLEAMIERLLVIQAGEAEDIQVQDYEMEMFVDNFLQQNPGLSSREDLEKALQSIGSSMEQFIKESRQGIMMEKVRQQLVYRRVSVSEAELRDDYFQHQDRYRIPATVRLQEIFIAAPAGGREEARQRAEWVLANLRDSRADFGETARQVSDSPSAETGGDLGEFALDSLSPAMRELVDGLESGQVGGPLETASGLQIVRVAEKKATSSRPLLEVREEILEAVRGEKRRQALRDFVQQLKQKAYIKIYPEYVR